jgi:tetratricopeptide (TPR) repeat protein
VGTAIQARTADRERAIAQRRFNEVRQLSNKLFDIDAEARQLPGSTKTRQLIVDTSLEYLRRLSSGVSGDPGLALELGHAYMRVARVQGVPISPNLGQMDRAEQSLRIAQELIQSVLASQPANRSALLRAAQIAHDRMLLARLQGSRGDEALEFAREAAGWLERFNYGKDDKPETTAVLTTYMNVADEFRIGRQFDDALRLSRRGAELARSVGHRPYLGMFLKVSALVLQRQGDLEEALKAIHESADLLDGGAGKRELGQLMNLALVLTFEGVILGQSDGISLGRPGEAAKSLERAFRIADEEAHRDTIDQSSRGRLAMAGLAWADILRRSDPGQAVIVYDHTLRHLAEVAGNSTFRRYEVESLAGSANALQRLGRFAKARERLDAAFERLSRLKLYPAEKVSPRSAAYQALCARADFEAATGHIPLAIDVYAMLLAKMQAAKIEPDANLEDAVDLSNIYQAMAGLHRRNREPGQADALAALRLELWRNWDDKLPGNPFVRRQLEAARPR